MRSSISMIRWGSIFLVRLLLLACFTLYQSRVNSMPLISPRNAPSMTQSPQGHIEPCAVDNKTKSMGHTILEGWSVPAVGMGMFVLVVISGVLSGLTLALMSIDMTRLHVLSVSGTPKQRRMAKTILPVKRYPYFLLCSLLISSVLVNEMLPIMNAKLFGESYKALFISATLVIVFGEIIPQAVFPRYALELGSGIIWLVYLCMTVCCIPAAVLSGALYYTLKGSGSAQNMFTADELVTFVELHSEDHINGNGGTLDSRAVSVIRNVIKAQDRVVGDIAKSLDQVYMVNGQLKLDKELLQKILSWGYSKIPVFEKSTEVYEDSGLPRISFLGYIQIKKLHDVDLELFRNVRDIKLTRLPIIDKDCSIYDALTMFRTVHARMALLADPAKEIQGDPNVSHTFCHGQYTNPRIQLEVGMGRSTLKLLQNDLIWTNNRHARQKEITGIVTIEDIMRVLLGKPIYDVSDLRPLYKEGNSADVGICISKLEKHLTHSSMSTGSSTTISVTPSLDEGKYPLGGLDINIFEGAQSRLSLASTWESLEKSQSSGINDIIQIDGTNNEDDDDGASTDTSASRGGYNHATLRRRFSFEDGLDEKGANLLEKGN